MIDLTDIKQKSCISYLESIGCRAHKKSGKYTIFKPPYREERTPSLCVNNAKNTFFDYGMGFGGDVIRLVEICQKVDFKEAVNILSEGAFQKVQISDNPKSAVEIIKVGEIRKRYLIQYLQGRKINIDIARFYCHQVEFRLNDKNQFAIGFKNDKGGFELRNKYIKISTAPKHFSTINKGFAGQSVFEGFIDFLSLCSFFNRLPKEEIIVLNSVSLISRVDIKPGAKFFGDNDHAGDSCFSKMKGAKDQRYLYQGYNDINDYVISQNEKLTK